MQNRKLVRNTQDTVFGGVCSGFANYFGWDPTWVRVAAALSILVFAGTPILIYLILWAVIPADISVYGPGAWQTTYQPQAYAQQQYPGPYPQQGSEGQYPTDQWQQPQQTAFDQGYSQGYQQTQPEQSR